MKKHLVALVVALSSAGLMAVPRPKAVVYVDHFIPVKGENCQIKDSEIQVLQDRIVGNVVSSRKYEVVERENLEKVQDELKLVDAGLTEGKAPESNRLKAAGYIIYGKIIQFRNYVNQAPIGDMCVTALKGTIELQIRIVNITTARQLAAKTIKKEVVRRLSNALATTENLELEVMTEALDMVAKDVVFKLNEIAFPVYITDADGKYVTANVSAEQVSLLIPHQANTRIIQSVAKRLNIPSEKVYVNIENYANTSSASIPIALDEAMRGGRIKRGDYVLFVSFGAGLTWGATLVLF